MVIAPEVNAGRRLVQTGFMRRFDQSHVAMKAAFDEGALEKGGDDAQFPPQCGSPELVHGPNGHLQFGPA